MSPRSTLRRSPPDGAVDAGELAETARGLAPALPGLARQAEGFQPAARRLDKALQLAQRVAASKPADRVPGGGPPPRG